MGRKLQGKSCFKPFGEQLHKGRKSLPGLCFISKEWKSKFEICFPEIQIPNDAAWCFICMDHAKGLYDDKINPAPINSRPQSGEVQIQDAGLCSFPCNYQLT